MTTMPGAASRGARVRLDEVAARADVSKATASKALNAKADVSAATRAKVLAAAEELGYVRSDGDPGAGYRPAALVADGLTTTYTLEVIRGAVDAAMAAGVALVTQHATAEDEPVHRTPLSDEWFDLLKANRFMGAIVITTRLSGHQLAKAREIGLPLVAIDPANQLPPSVASIGATNWNGGVDATNHLLGLGHLRIAFIKGPRNSVPSNERLQGYLSALGMAGIAPRADLVVGAEYSYEEGLAAGRALLALPADRRPTAVFAASDTSALGVVEAAREAALRVPDDLSVVGFDDTFLAELGTPQLTTVHQPLAAMGAAAVRLLVALDRREPATLGPIRLATELIVRGSTAPPA